MYKAPNFALVAKWSVFYLRGHCYFSSQFRGPQVRGPSLSDQHGRWCFEEVMLGQRLIHVELEVTSHQDCFADGRTVEITRPGQRHVGVRGDNRTVEV